MVYFFKNTILKWSPLCLPPPFPSAIHSSSSWLPRPPLLSSLASPLLLAADRSKVDLTDIKIILKIQIHQIIYELTLMNEGSEMNSPWTNCRPMHSYYADWPARSGYHKNWNGGGSPTPGGSRSEFLDQNFFEKSLLQILERRRSRERSP